MATRSSIAMRKLRTLISMVITMVELARSGFNAGKMRRIIMVSVADVITSTLLQVTAECQNLSPAG
jgi:hypothetical protein